MDANAQSTRATTLIHEALTAGIISQDEENILIDQHIEEIDPMRTPQEVGDYAFKLFRETDEAREARIVQERAALDEVRQNARNQVQERVNERLTLMNQSQPMGGSRRRRKRSRKSRKHRR